MNAPKCTEYDYINFLVAAQQMFSAVEAQITAAQEVKRGVMQRLLENGLSGSASHWKQTTLGDICDNLDTKRVPISQDKRIPGPYPYYGASGITDWVKDYIFDETLILVAEDGKNLLYSNSPIAWRVDGKCWVNNHAHVFRAKEQVDTDFVVHKLDSMPLNPYVTGSYLLKLTQEDALSIRLDLPPLGEQREIVAILNAYDATIRNLQVEAASLREVKRGLMQKLLSGQVRV